MSEQEQVGRLALRVQGDKWVAYYALADTMDGAIWLGEIHMAIVRDHEMKQAFMELMKGAISNLLKGKIGVAPNWPDPPHAAPEHERSGSA